MRSATRASRLLAPVFVDVEFAVVIHVLKLQAVYLEDLGGTLQIGQPGLFAIGFDQSEFQLLGEQFRLGRTLGRGCLFRKGRSAERRKQHDERKQQGQFLHRFYSFH